MLRAYFRVKNFSILYFDNDENKFKTYPVDNKMKDFILSHIYYLNTIYDNHYDPDLFISYIKYVANNNPDKKFTVHYVYIYYNHFMNNEYKNMLTICNDDIVNNII